MSPPGGFGTWLQVNVIDEPVGRIGMVACLAFAALCVGACIGKRTRAACRGTLSIVALFSPQSSARRRARTGSLQLGIDGGVPMTRLQSSRGSCFSPTSDPHHGFAHTGACAQGLPSKGGAEPTGIVLQGIDACAEQGPVVQGMALTSSMSASAPPICVAGVAISDAPRV